MLRTQLTFSGVPSSLPRFAYSIRGRTVCINDYWMIVMSSPGRPDGSIECDELRKAIEERREPKVGVADNFYTVAADLLESVSEFGYRGKIPVSAGMLIKMIRSLGLEESEIYISLDKDSVTIKIESIDGKLTGFLVGLAEDS